MHFLGHFGQSIKNESQLKIEVVKVCFLRLIFFVAILAVVLLVSLFFGAQVSIPKNGGGARLKIDGGQRAQEGDCPSIVFLGCPQGTRKEKGRWKRKIDLRLDLDDYCGAGSIINENWVLTAAHLCYNGPSFIVAGVHNVNQPKRQWQRRIVQKVYRHPAWNLSTTQFDLCVMKLATPLNLNKSKFIQAANFSWSENMTRVGAQLMTFGWGRTSLRSPTYSPVLLKVGQLAVVSFEECQAKFNGVSFIDPNSMLCAASPGHGPCNGDSGAPLVWSQDGSEGTKNGVQVGVVSWGIECAHEYYPNVYAHVQNSIQWIHQMTTN